MSFRPAAARGATLFALLLAAAACSDDESVFNAEAGECIASLSDLSGQITELPETECTEPHEAQVVAVFEHEGDDFPGTQALIEEARESCEGDAFEEFTGTEYAESAIIVNYITPTEQTWGEGDRETICVGGTGGSVDVSFEGNGQDFLLGG